MYRDTYKVDKRRNKEEDKHSKNREDITLFKSRASKMVKRWSRLWEPLN